MTSEWNVVGVCSSACCVYIAAQSVRLKSCVFMNWSVLCVCKTKNYVNLICIKCECASDIFKNKMDAFSEFFRQQRHRNSWWVQNYVPHSSECVCVLNYASWIFEYRVSILSWSAYQLKSLTEVFIEFSFHLIKIYFFVCAWYCYM
jgi:hypothetical protein